LNFRIGCHFLSKQLMSYLKTKKAEEAKTRATNIA